MYRPSDDGPPDNKPGTVFRTRCCKCGWEEDETHLDQGECEIDECPDCGSDYLEDSEEEYED